MSDERIPHLTVHGLMTGKPKLELVRSKSFLEDNRSLSASKIYQQPKYLVASGAEGMSRQDDVSKLSHFSKAITGSVGEKTHEKVDNEKQLQDISKRLKWEEAREKVSKALKNAATPDGLIAINIKRLTYFNTDKIQRLVTKAVAAHEALTMKRVQQMAEDELKTKRTQKDGPGKRLLALEKCLLPGVAEGEVDEQDGNQDTLEMSNQSAIDLSEQSLASKARSKRLVPGGRSSEVSAKSNETGKTKTIFPVTSTHSGRTARTRRRRRGTDLDSVVLSSMKDFTVDKAWFEANPRIYFSIRTPLACKTTAAVVLPNTSEDDVLIDSLVHFTCNINPLKESSENVITISIVAFLPTDEAHHYFISERHFYMIDIIRANCVADGYKFKSIIGDQLLAEVDMEMCFGYGMFGYGYSNQLLNAGKPISEGVARSIFIRADPGPETEKVKEAKGIESRIKGHAALAPKVTHPSYLDYRNKLDIHDASAICDKLDGSDKPSEAEVAASVRPPVVTLTEDEESRIRRMLQQTSLSSWMSKFNTITDRRERLVFLRGIILSDAECFEAHHIKGLKPIDDEPSQIKDNLSKFNEMHNVKICHVKNMAALKLKPEKT